MLRSRPRWPTTWLLSSSAALMRRPTTTNAPMSKRCCNLTRYPCPCSSLHAQKDDTAVAGLGEMLSAICVSLTPSSV